MDRNVVDGHTVHITRNVALRKESVDRNVDLVKYCLHAAVALRKESVDRNFPQSNIIKLIPGSLSARRAWIEIFVQPD